MTMFEGLMVLISMLRTGKCDTKEGYHHLEEAMPSWPALLQVQIKLFGLIIQ